MARAGLFDGVSHTSNAAGWIDERIGAYAGQRHYRDVPYAVTDHRIVSAPGTAPGTFACMVIEALHPDRGEEIAQMRALISREFKDP